MARFVIRNGHQNTCVVVWLDYEETWMIPPTTFASQIRFRSLEQQVLTGWKKFPIWPNDPSCVRGWKLHYKASYLTLASLKKKSMFLWRERRIIACKYISHSCNTKKRRNFDPQRGLTWMKCLFVPPRDLCPRDIGVGVMQHNTKVLKSYATQKLIWHRN